MSTRDDILRLLHRNAMTVAQLGEKLGVTRNAITVQIRQLEAAGMIRRFEQDEPRRVGKPPTLFIARSGTEDADSAVYRVLTSTLLATLKKNLAAEQLLDLLVATGRQLAREARLGGSAGDFDSSLKTAIDVVNALGANAEAEAGLDGVMVRSYGCPVAAGVRAEPCLCETMAAFFAEATGFPVEARCLRGDRLICQYLIKKVPLAEEPYPDNPSDPRH